MHAAALQIKVGFHKENRMKFFFLILIAVASCNVISDVLEINRSIAATIDALSEKSKRELLIEYLAREEDKRKEIKLRQLISDPSKSSEVIQIIKTRKLTPSFELGGSIPLIEFSSLMNNVEVTAFLADSYEVEGFLLQNSLELACANKNIKIVKYFLKKGVDVNNTYRDENWLCIFSAIKNADVEMVRLIAKKLDFSKENESSFTIEEYVNNLQSDFKKIELIIIKESRL